SPPHARAARRPGRPAPVRRAPGTGTPPAGSRWRSAGCRPGPGGGPPGCSRSGRGAPGPDGCEGPSRRAVRVEPQIDDGGVAPEPLEGVEGAVLGMLDVHDDVAVVQQHPAGVALALATQRLAAPLREKGLLDAVHDGGHLPFGFPAADQDHVGADDERGDVEADHLLGELVGGGPAGGAGVCLGGARGAGASRRGGARGGSGWAAAWSGARAGAVSGPRTPVGSRTTSTTRAMAVSAHTTHWSRRPLLPSGRCSTLPSKRGAGRGSGASVTESSPSSTPSWSRLIVATDEFSAEAASGSVADGAGCSLSSMMRARRPNLRRVGTGSSAVGGATAPRTPGAADCSPWASIEARASRAACSSGVRVRARRPRRGVVSGSVIGRHLLCRARTC